MKKLLCVMTAILVSVCLMTACSFTSNVSNNSSTASMEYQTELETVLDYLSAGELGKAADMMHADKTDTTGLEQISEYMRGRAVNKLEFKGVNVSRTTSGNQTAVQEDAELSVTLSDGEKVYLKVVYLENQKSKGFLSIQMVLGVI